MTCVANKLNKKAAAAPVAALVGGGAGAAAGYGLGNAFDLSTTGKILAALGGGAAGGAAGYALGKSKDDYKDTTGTGLPWHKAHEKELYTLGGGLAGAGVGYAANRFVGRNTDAVSAIGSILAGGGLGALAGNLYESGILSDSGKRLVETAARKGIQYGSPEWENLAKKIEAETTDEGVSDVDKALEWLKNNGTSTAIGGAIAAPFAARAFKGNAGYNAFQEALKTADPTTGTATKDELINMMKAYKKAERAQMLPVGRAWADGRMFVPWKGTSYKPTASALQSIMPALQASKGKPVGALTKLMSILGYL